jgi:hypothetical protein
LTSAIVPASPETAIVDGYGAAGPDETGQGSLPSLIEIALVFENVSALACAAVAKLASATAATNPNVLGVFIDGGFDDQGGRTDDEIIVDFARALSVDPEAHSLLGCVDRRYVTGFSDSSLPVLRLVTSGQADGVFDLAFPITAEGDDPEGDDPQTALTDGRFDGKLVILNSEAEGVSANFVDAGVAPSQYRFYAVAGTPHIPDFLVPPFPPSSMTTPASFLPELRAHFLQGDTG